ncbi:hypothetical protein [Akkermansia sp.]|nr:hypothetical protein [Akkermansia sp.]MCC8148238.1 hypothetical protein [Akkermansia sp.]
MSKELSVNGKKNQGILPASQYKELFLQGAIKKNAKKRKNRLHGPSQA